MKKTIVLSHVDRYALFVRRQQGVCYHGNAFTFKGRIDDGDSLRFISGRKSAVSFIVEPGTLTLDLVEGKNLGGTPQNDAHMVTIIDQHTRQEVQLALSEVASSHMARRTFIGNIYKKLKIPTL